MTADDRTANRSIGSWIVGRGNEPQSAISVRPTSGDLDKVSRDIRRHRRAFRPGQLKTRVAVHELPEARRSVCGLSFVEHMKLMFDFSGAGVPVGPDSASFHSRRVATHPSDTFRAAPIKGFHPASRT
jgi:hypothetical protein